MCGIAGLVDFDGRHAPASLVRAILGNRRLSIIDDARRVEGETRTA